MRSFTAVFTFLLAVNYSLAADWADAGIKVNTMQVRKNLDTVKLPYFHNFNPRLQIPIPDFFGRKLNLMKFKKSKRFRHYSLFET